METKKKIVAMVCIVLAIVSTLSFLQVTGVMKFLAVRPLSATTPQGQVGITLTTTNKNYFQPLSAVSPSQTYQWELTASNTGNVDWVNSWVTVRVAVNGATVTDKTEPGTTGLFKVEKCPYGTDVAMCREDISAFGWDLQYHFGSCAGGGTWFYPEAGNKVATIFYGDLSTGMSKSACFKLSVPLSASGDYPLITNLQAYAGGIYSVASQVDNLGIGVISGDLTMSFVGVISLLSMLAILGIFLI